MKSQEVMRQLEAWSDENVRRVNAKNGAGENQFGVNPGKLRELAKKIESDDALAMSRSSRARRLTRLRER